MVPATEITGLTVASVSEARPPQPVRVSELLVPVSHRVCWSEWENRLSGSNGEFATAARYWALVIGCTRVPRLKTGASRPSAQTLPSADIAGCRPYDTPVSGVRLACGIARPPRTPAYCA